MIVNNISNRVSSASTQFANAQYNNFLSKHKLEPDTEFVDKFSIRFKFVLR